MIPDLFATPDDVKTFVREAMCRGSGMTDGELFELHLALERSEWPEPDAPCEECARADDEWEQELPFLGLAEKLESMTEDLLEMPVGHTANDVVRIVKKWFVLIGKEHGYDMTDVLTRLDATIESPAMLGYALRRVRDGIEIGGNRMIDLGCLAVERSAAAVRHWRARR